MKKLALAALGAVAAACFAPVAQAAEFTDADMDIEFGPGGTISANFGNSGIVEGAFTDYFRFTLPTSGLASGSLTTSAVTFGDLTDLDFTSVFFNDVELHGTIGAQNEVVFANAVPITGGALNTITITGLSRGNGSYGGQGVFTPSATAVPEPASWAMMLVGFGAVGYASRRKPRRLLQAV